jgi:hypothetical protein
MIRTYIPDDEPVRVEEHGDFIRVRQPVQQETEIEKELDISLAQDRPSANVVHRLRNHNLWPVDLAPWALSTMRDSGTCFLPLPSRLNLSRFCVQPSCPIQSGEKGRWGSMTKYPDELKREALNLAAKLGVSAAQVERDLGNHAGIDLQVAAALSGGRE